MDKIPIVHIKNITDSTVLKIEGTEELHLIGFGQDGDVQTAPMSSSDRFTDLPSGIVVPLLMLTKCHHGGLMLTSHNKDVSCFVNKERLTSEINLLGGSTIEVADKKLRVFIGPMAKERRLLPHTPGVAVSRTPPPKPGRQGENQPLQRAVSEESSDWFHVQHPSMDPDLFEKSASSKQLGGLAASFLTKQVHMYTDSKLSSKMTDQIFRFLQEVAEYQRNVVLGYLNEVTSYLDEMPESERDRPIHAPSIKLLVEILRQILDPLSHVVLCLQLLRKFSHFPQNIPIMIKCQAAAAVMGCMAVYLNQEDVQSNCLDILAKITTYQYQITEKVQVRETALEMILRALKHHEDHEEILQSGCRTLSNLTATLQMTLESWLDIPYNINPDVEEGIVKYESLLNHIFTTATSTVQIILQNYMNNIGIRTEGRRFLFHLSKMTQILTKKGKRSLIVHESDEDEDENSRNTSENLVTPTVLAPMKTDIETKGILRQDGEKTPGALRKVHFVDNQSLTSSSATEEDSDEDDEVTFVQRKEAGGAVIEITETRKLTKTEIQNFHIQTTSDSELLSTFESSIESCGDYKEVKNENKEMSELESDSELEKSVESQDLGEDDNLGETVNLSQESNVLSSIDTDLQGSVQKGQETDTSQSSLQNDGTLDTVFCNGQKNISSNATKDVVTDQESDLPPFPHSFSVSDVELLTNVIRSKIVEYVSCMVIDGNDSQALKDIDLSLVSLLEKAEVSPRLLQYVQQQYNHSKTLMDIDTSYLIGIVDAVRYTSLLPDLLRKSLLDVAACLEKNKDTFVIFVAAESIKTVFTKDILISVVFDKSFSEAMKTHLQQVEHRSRLLQDIVKLLSDS
ncbi:uncharacterized protein LOC127701936 [Mytilus californianus]|uniref:uncharacterized protein LOC127701936 n=1 Tax=Mytilus californianus TaxID=6549 RepID=UPI0022471FA7|nr:uncharacterized protein LOC127701936 [Mytilus californianus]